MVFSLEKEIEYWESNYSKTIEQYILGCFLIRPSLVDEYTGRVSATSFPEWQDKRIYECIDGLRDKSTTADLLEIGRALGADLKPIGAIYIDRLMENIITTSNVDFFISLIEQREKRTEYERFSVELDRCIKVGDDLGSVNIMIRDWLNKMIESDGKDESKDESLDRMIADLENPPEQTIIKTGILSIDRIHDGFRPGEVTILAARPSMGKSAFALNIATNVAMQGHGVALFSLEDTRRIVNARICSRLAQVNLGCLLNSDKYRNLSVQSKNCIKVVVANMKELPLYIHDKPMTTNQIRGSIMLEMNKHNVKFVVIDHLGHVSDPVNKDLYHTTTVAIRNIAQCAKENDIHILCLHQLNRGSENRDNSMPRMADLRQSGEIEQLARGIWFIHRKSYYSPGANEDQANLIINKNSHGEKGMVELYCNLSQMHFCDRKEEW